MTTNVVFSLTFNISFTVVTAMNSIVSNANEPQQLRFYLVVPEGEQDRFQDYLAKVCPTYVHQIQVVSFSPPPELCSFVSQYYPHRREARYMNYARFYFDMVLKDVRKVIYLDTDLVVLKDLQSLFDEVTFNKRQFYAAVPHTYWAPLYFNNPFRHWREVKKINKPFNGGVFVTDLRFWGNEVRDRLQYFYDLCDSNKGKPWSLSTEPLQNLVFPNYIQLDRQWNRCGYGNYPWIARFLKVPLERIAVLHWSGGVTKPWTHPHIMYSEIWRQYQPEDA